MKEQIDPAASALGPWLAQRSGRQQPAIADTAVVKDSDFDVALQGIVLQAIVANHHARFGVSEQQGTQGVSALRRYKNRSTCRTLYKGWLVTRGLDWNLCGDFKGFVARSAVTPRHHASPMTLRLQMPDQRDHQWGLARPASDHIAHHDNSHREALGLQNAKPVEDAASAQECAVGKSHRPKRPGQPSA